MAVIPVLVQPNHPMLSGCKFFSVVDSSTSINCLLPVAGTVGTVSGGATLGTLGLPPWNAIVGDATNNLVTWANFSTYFGSTDRDITVIMRAKAKSSHIGGAAGCRVASPVNGWQMLFSNFSASETGWNFAVFSAAGKFQEAQDGIGAATQVNKDVVVAGTYANATKVVQCYTRQPTDNAAVFRNNRTNTNSANVALDDWDVRCTTPMVWLATRTGADFGNIDVAWAAVFNRVLTASEIAAFSRDEEWPFITGVPTPPIMASAPPSLNHPLNTIRHRMSMLRGPTSPPPPPAIVTNQIQLPLFAGGPLRGPWRKGPASLAASVPVPTPPIIPPMPQVYLPVFSGGPLTGPWHKGPSVPKPLVAPPGAPPVISPQVNLPVFFGGPLTGPWHRGPHQPPVPVPPPPPAPPTPPPAKERPFFDIDAGKEVNVRLRRHTQKLSTALNSLIRQDILVQTGDVDWTLDLTGGVLTGLTGTFNSGRFGTG